MNKLYFDVFVCKCVNISMYLYLHEREENLSLGDVRRWTDTCETVKLTLPPNKHVVASAKNLFEIIFVWKSKSYLFGNINHICGQTAKTYMLPAQRICLKRPIIFVRILEIKCSFAEIYNWPTFMMKGYTADKTIFSAIEKKPAAAKFQYTNVFSIF